jgi:hypothetical protein
MPHSSKNKKTGTGGRVLFVVFVDFQLKPGARSRFRRLIDEDCARVTRCDLAFSGADVASNRLSH